MRGPAVRRLEDLRPRGPSRPAPTRGRRWRTLARLAPRVRKRHGGQVISTWSCCSSRSVRSLACACSWRCAGRSCGRVRMTLRRCAGSLAILVPAAIACAPRAGARCLSERQVVRAAARPTRMRHEPVATVIAAARRANAKHPTNKRAEHPGATPTPAAARVLRTSPRLAATPPRSARPSRRSPQPFSPSALRQPAWLQRPARRRRAPR